MFLQGSSVGHSIQRGTSVEGCRSGTPLQPKSVRYTVGTGLYSPMVRCRATHTDESLNFKREGNFTAAVLDTSHSVSISRPCRPSSGIVMAAAVWPGPEASFDEEQSWWAAGPLSWRIAEEREQWRAEQQMLPQQKLPQNRRAQAAAVGEALASVDQEAVDTEQQWLQPPVALEPPQ